MTTKEFLGEKTRPLRGGIKRRFRGEDQRVLLILTFLGTISATRLTADRLAAKPKLAQIPVIATIVISGIFCLACLWPKDYWFDDLPETHTNWLADLEESNSERLEGITRLSLELANGRIPHNHALNKTKACTIRLRTTHSSHFPAISLSTSSAFEGKASLNLTSLPS